MCRTGGTCTRPTPARPRASPHTEAPAIGATARSPDSLLTAGSSRAQECCLCPEKGGALKRTTDWRWAHVVCALWVPNVSFVDPESRDAIDLFGMDEKRFALSCGLCGVQKGACIQCKERKCMRAFHVTCARKHDLHMTEKERDDWVEFSVFCDKHKPKPVGKRRRKPTA
jgi:hypothetical protein